MTTGKFISFESIDGLGKSTQATLLVEALRKQGYDVLLTKEPGDAKAGANVGPGVRHLLFKEPSTNNLRPGVADMLFLADHIQCAGDVAEAVSQGKIVIADRYADSQFAYAASGTKACPQWALDVYQANYGIEPDATVLLVARGIPLSEGDYPHLSVDMQYEEDISWALDRARARRGEEAGKQDGKAWNQAEEQRKIQNAYIRQLRFEARLVRVDIVERDSIEAVHEFILSRVTQRLWGTTQLRSA